MMNQNITPLRLTLSALLWWAIAAAQAQTVPLDATEKAAPPETARWYQVEMAIFARDNWQAETEEVWPARQQLQYPNRLAVLKPDAGSNTPTAQPFILLDPSAKKLTSALNRITRSEEFRPLFHETWRQPMFARDQADNIVIRGGAQYDDHFELEGVVTIGVERYLHISTDLWFSRFMANTGQDSNWQTLPSPPVGQWVSDGADQLAAKQLTPFNALAPNNFSSSFEQFIRRQYAVERTVVMREQRRMRSAELHYLDHPMLGILIKITPLTAPTPDTIPPQPATSTLAPLGADTPINSTPSSIFAPQSPTP